MARIQLGVINNKHHDKESTEFYLEEEVMEKETIHSKIALEQNSIDLLKRSLTHYSMPLTDEEGNLFVPCLFEWCYPTLKEGLWLCYGVL